MPVYLYNPLDYMVTTVSPYVSCNPNMPVIRITLKIKITDYLHDAYIDWITKTGTPLNLLPVVH